MGALVLYLNLPRHIGQKICPPLQSGRRACLSFYSDRQLLQGISGRWGETSSSLASELTGLLSTVGAIRLLLNLPPILIAPYRYASDLSPDQKDALLDVIRVRPHAQIGPEVRRELVNSASKNDQRDHDMEMS